jgi:hypothetical protein
MGTCIIEYSLESNEATTLVEMIAFHLEGGNGSVLQALHQLVALLESKAIIL